MVSQRLTTAGLRAINSHTNVRRLAERLCKELEDTEQPSQVLTMDLDPDDPMVMAVEKVIAVTSSMEAVTSSMEVVTEARLPTGARLPSTKPGIGAHSMQPVRTKPGMVPPVKRTKPDEEG